MARERDHFAVAHGALAGYAAEGRFGWGHPLVATALAAELGLSPTPVREALAHLAGEGVIEHRPGRGYFAPSPSSSDIAELYDFHRFLILSALREGPFPEAATRLAEENPELEAETVFQALAGASWNSVLVQEQARVAALLRPIRKVEAIVAPLTGDILKILVTAVKAGSGSALENAVDLYHRDRVDQAQTVFAAMRRSAKSIVQI